MIEPPKLRLPRGDRFCLQSIHTALDDAEAYFQAITPKTKQVCEESHPPMATLPYCLRWALKACEDLIEKATLTIPAPIWVSKKALAKHLKLRSSQIEQFTKSRVFMVWHPKGKRLYDLVECRAKLERFKESKRSQPKPK